MLFHLIQRDRKNLGLKLKAWEKDTVGEEWLIAPTLF